MGTPGLKMLAMTPATSAASRRPNAVESPQQSLVQRGKDAQRQADEYEQKMTEAAAKGSKIGGAVGGGIGSAMMIWKGLKSTPAVPLSTFARTLSVAGAGFSGYGIGTAVLDILKDLRAPTVDARLLIQHSLNLAGNAVVLGGTLAIATGAGAGPGLIAIGVGTLMTGGASLLSP